MRVCPARNPSLIISALFINMLVNRIAKALFNVSKREIVPKAPRLTSGELEPFRLEAENAQLYDGYTLDELYGVKMGAKHPPAVKAEMMKDNIAAGMLFVIGMGILIHFNNIFRRELEEVKGVQQAKHSRKVIF